MAQIKHQQVAKVAFYQDETLVEVLDVNGLQRSVKIFPEAVPYLVGDLRDAHVDFYVAPPLEHEVSPLVPFLSAFCATLVMLMIFEALGLLGMVLFAWGMMLESLTQWADDVGKGFELTVAEWTKGGAAGAAPGGATDEAAQQGEAIPVLIEDEQQQQQQQQQHDFSSTPPSTTTSATKPDDDLRP